MKSAPEKSKNPLHIVFLHLDLGIGGAEQLVVNLALASLPLPPEESESNSNQEGTEASLNSRISIFTTHCNQNHCFDAVNKTLKPPGKLANSVHVMGAFLPVTIFGKGTAFCSTIRMMYLSFMARRMHPDADVFVLDVLPTPIPYLVQRSKCVIYYCHFPDKLLTRDTVNGETSPVLDSESMNKTTRGGSKAKIKSHFKKQYRRILDYMEEWAMSYADLICVNSNFTKTEVISAFPSLDKTQGGKDTLMKVLYPAIDLNKFIPPDFARKQKLLDTGDRAQSPIVSLNRFERKKNIQVLLHAYASIHEDFKRGNKLASLPPLVISGGYDPRNIENVEYLTELKTLAKSLQIEESTKFRPSVSDEERAILLQSAICVVYTPHREHFGIVPLEAMYAGSAVVAIKSGGPKESVLDGVTGILVDMKSGNSSDSLAKAMKQLLDDPSKAIEMGKRGHEHVKEHFGLDPFRREWKRLVVDEGIPRGHQREVNSSNRMALVLSYAVLLLAWYVARYFFIGTSD